MRARCGVRSSTRRFVAIVAVLIAAAWSAATFADGGVVAASRAEGSRRTTAFLSPVAPRVGLVDVSVLLTVDDVPETGAVPIEIRATHLPSGIERSASAEPAHQGNRLLRSANLDLPSVGTWRIEIALERAFPPLEFDVSVGAPAPPWTRSWPFLFAWIPLVLLLCVRDRLATRLGRGRSGDRSAANLDER